MQPTDRIALVIPAYNEEETVGAVVRDCLAALPGASVCVVSDGSSDRTAARAREAGATVLEMPCNLGVGPAVQAGLQWARDRGFEIVARLDADGQHPPAEIPKLLARMEETGADFVVGSRFLPGSSFETGSTRTRRFGNHALARFLSIICRCPVTDPTSGLWCARGALVRYFAHRYPAEYPEPEAMALLRRQGYAMTEAPVRVLPRQAGVSHLRSFGVLYFALRVGLALLADRVRPVDPRFAKSRMRPGPARRGTARPPAKTLLLPFLAAVFAAAPSARAAGDVPGDLVYEASEPAYAALEKQSEAFVAKLRAAPDDAARGAAADSFLAYLAGVESKLSAAGKADFAAEVGAYREKVLAWSEDLLTGTDDPFADDGEDPFAGSSEDPFAAPAAPKKPAYDPNDPFATPPEEMKPAAPKKPAYDPNDPFAAPPKETKTAEKPPEPAKPAPAPEPPPAKPAAAGGNAPGPTPPAWADPLDELPPERPAPQPAQAAAQQPQQQQPPQSSAPPSAPGGGGWLSDPYVVEIDSTQPGIGIGPFEDGDLLVLRYKSGEWTSEENRRFKVKPDVPRVDAREKLVLVDADGGILEVPGHTDAAPFAYAVESGGEVKLRIGEDPGQDHEHLVDNAGAVVYLAYVIGAEDADAFRASSEGRRCQFAKTNAEKKAEAAAEAAKRGDPFTLETTKKDDDWDFDFTQNDGRFTIRADGTEFTMHWTRGPNEEVVFASADGVRQIGGKKGFKRLPNTTKAFDDLVFAPGSRTVHKGEVVVFQNGEGRMLGVRVDGIRLPNPRTGFPGKLSIHWHLY